MKSKIKLAVIALILANIIWGAAFPIYKLSLDIIPPFTFVFLRFFIGGLILLPFTYKKLKIKPSDLIPLILLSVFGITLTISFLNLGLKLTSSINAPIIISASPIILIIASFIFLKEKIKSKILVGTLVSFAGVLIIVLMPLFEHGIDGSVTGNLFLVFAAIFSVIHAILIKKIISKYNPLTIVFWSFLIGSIPLLPFVANEFNQTHWVNHLNNQTIFSLLFTIFVATTIAHSLFTFGIKYIAATEIGIFSYIDPIATILVAIPLLHEVLTMPYVIGSFLVFMGIIIAEKRLNYHPLYRLFK